MSGYGGFACEVVTRLEGRQSGRGHSFFRFMALQRKRVI